MRNNFNEQTQGVEIEVGYIRWTRVRGETRVFVKRWKKRESYMSNKKKKKTDTPPSSSPPSLPPSFYPSTFALLSFHTMLPCSVVENGLRWEQRNNTVV